jgi:hypothetical protein
LIEVLVDAVDHPGRVVEQGDLVDADRFVVKAVLAEEVGDAPDVAAFHSDLLRDRPPPARQTRRQLL